MALAANERVVYFQVVPVQIQGENRVATIETFAIVDDGSSDTLIRRDIADKLNLEGPERLLRLGNIENKGTCLLYTSPSPRDGLLSRMPSSA